MSEDSAEQGSYGTRWGIFAAAFTPAIALAGAALTAIATGALAVSFVAESGSMRLTTSGLRAGGVGLGSVLVRHGNGKSFYEARVGVADATGNGLCISQRFAILGMHYTLVLKAGDNDPSTYEIKANGLLLDVPQLRGQIYTSGQTQVNKNAAEVRIGDSALSLNGTPDRFGLQAETGVFKQLEATVHDIVIPNVLATPNFSLDVLPGDHPCPAPATPSD